MRGVIVSRTLVALAVAVGLVFVAGPAAAATPKGKVSALTCTGGEIGSGTYSSITVTGDCAVAKDAVVKVIGNIKVRAGAKLDAHTSPSTIKVGRNVIASAGSWLALGCQPRAVAGNSAHPCLDAEGLPIEDASVYSTIDVRGSIAAIGAEVVLINGIKVGGNLTITGGGSADIPWSVKNNTIKGNLRASELTTNWFGVLFNKVGRSVKLSNIILLEDHPGAAGVVYVVQNKIRRNLVCHGLPGVSGGFVPGAVNTVGGRVVGQCVGLAG